ncbi:helix-turn-helix domain-containing protein [Flammeovirga sp. OC4]|uniref:helix-turn-helix domain-containing protein n=1 Tax=Flammeovirga sp. OC4 TaxID=1382345 RepID=UPI00155DC4F7|nr:helix-turn-helix domain-containing protein [Flammeovirga sp. OC4]
MSQESKENNDRLTIQQLSQEYSLCRSTIHKFMKDGRLKYHKFGRKTLFKRVDIEKCITTKGKHM